MIRRIYKKFATILLLAAFFVPQYPNAQKIDEKNTNINGVRLVTLFFTTPDAIEQVIDYYKEALKNEFELIVNGPPSQGASQAGLGGAFNEWYQGLAAKAPEFNMLYFVKKDDQTIGLNLVCSKNSLYNQTMIQISFNLDPYQPRIPSGSLEGGDVAGKDPYWLRRYPDSKRVSYIEYTGGGFAATYEVKTDCLKCVVDYYRQEISGWGWTLLKEQKQNPDWANKNFQGLSDDLANKLKGYAQQVAKTKELNPETYFLEFKKEDEGRCMVVITFMDNRARTLIRYLPRANY
ncbi:MAG: hypothetical protein PHU91_00730 [Candidatus Omnitrophica bacterium]|nr:hypothetical protein [Candidatus Omnitrophota bacterium]MDD5236184.1 hypothetical protein [Candidatus Omnitrophota bacterium]MDD5610829.1 hypothetical protein [Candidatus Omnitrophota bacterium]